MTRVEKNILIAEYLGAKLEYNGSEGGFDMFGYLGFLEDGADEQHYFGYDELLFHDDWNWMRPVLVKIYSEIMCSNEYTGWYTKDFNPLNNNLDTLFERVVKYIQSK